MMNLLSLIKINLQQSLLFKNRKFKLIQTVLIMGLLGILLLYIGFIYAAMIAGVLDETGQYEPLIAFGIIFITMITLAFTTTKAGGYFFETEDFNLLSSLPIKRSTIFLSKLLSFMIVNSIFPILIGYSFFTIYGEETNQGLLFYLISLVSIPVFVLFASTIGIVLSFIAYRFLSKVKENDVLRVIVVSVVFIALIVLSQVLPYMKPENAEFVNDLLNKYYPPLTFFMKYVTDESYLNIIYLFASGILLVAVLAVALSKSFVITNQRLREKYSKRNYELGKFKQTNAFSALVKREAKQFISYTYYVVNNMFGAIMYLIAIILSFFISKEAITESVDGFTSDTMNVEVVSIYFMIGLVLILINGATAISISMEGKRLWILKSLPISFTKIAAAKVCLHFLINVPLHIVGAVVIGNKLDIEAHYILLNIFLGVTTFTFLSSLGIIINLYFPKLDWTEPMSVIKRSTAVLLSTLTSFVIIGVVIGITSYFDKDTLAYVLSGMIGMFIILVICIWSFIKIKGEKMFLNL